MFVFLPSPKHNHTYIYIYTRIYIYIYTHIYIFICKLMSTHDCLKFPVRRRRRQHPIPFSAHTVWRMNMGGASWSVEPREAPTEHVNQKSAPTRPQILRLQSNSSRAPPSQNTVSRGRGRCIASAPRTDRLHWHRHAVSEVDT